jgi:hypothetical protein
MSKKSKRLRDMRRNPHKVRYDDLIGVLQDYGFTIRDRSGSSHVFVSLSIGDNYWSATVVKPHGDAQYINETGMKKLLKQLSEIDSVLAKLDADADAVEAEDEEAGDDEDD